MQQIKIFKGIESEIGELENQINAWLKQNASVKIVNVFGNIAPQTVMRESSGSSGRAFSPSDVMMVICYEA